MNPALFSSASTEWATPAELFDKLHAEFRFTLDVCASAENARLPYYSKAQDGLAQDWRGQRCWMNPPYGVPEHPCKPACKKKKCKKRGHHVDKYVPGIGDWIAKAAGSAKLGVLVVALLPARTDTRWWHDFIWDEKCDAPRPGVRVRFLRRRRRFGGAKAGAPFPSVVVVFGAVLEES